MVQVDCSWDHKISRFWPQIPVCSQWEDSGPTYRQDYRGPFISLDSFEKLGQ